MKRSLSLLVVQVFTLNTLLSSSGLAHVAWSPINQSPKFQVQKREIANDAEFIDYLPAKEVLNIGTQDKRLIVTLNDGDTRTIYQSYVDPKLERFDFSKGTRSGNDGNFVKDKNGKEVPFEEVRKAYVQIVNQNRMAAQKLSTAAKEKIDDLRNKKILLEPSANGMRVYEYEINGEKHFRFVHNNEMEIHISESTRQLIIGVLSDAGAKKYTGQDKELIEIAKIFNGYSFGDAYDAIRAGGISAYFETSKQGPLVAFREAKQIAGPKSSGKPSFAIQNPFTTVTLNGVNKDNAVMLNPTAPDGKNVSFKNMLEVAPSKVTVGPSNGAPSGNSIFAAPSYGQTGSVKATDTTVTSQSPAIDPNDPISMTLQHSPEQLNGLGKGSSMEMAVTAVENKADPTNPDSEEKPEIDLKQEGEVKITPLTDAERKAVHDMFKPGEIRKMLREDRKMLIKNDIERWLEQSQGNRDRVATADWQRSIVGHQTRRFPLETIMFFFSIGLINGTMLQMDFSQNPLLMEQHLQTLTDPIGHISFYAFMLVNGYSTEFLNSRAFSKEVTADRMKDVLTLRDSKARIAAYAAAGNDEAAKKRILNVMAEDAVKLADRKGALNPYHNSVAKKAYISMIPYFGMTAGSMASHFSGDFLRTLQSCVTGMYIDPKKQKELAAAGPQQAKIKDRLNGLSEDPCDVAWREWVMEKKFNQYSPALASMILSTAASGVLTKLFKGSERIGPIGKVFETVRKTKAAVTAKLTIEGGNFVTRALSRGLTGLWTGTFNFVGHFTSITLFTALDTAMHSWVEDKVLNFNYGYYYIWPKIDAFPRKAEILNDLITKEGNEKFMKDTVACEKDIQSADCRRNDIEGWLYDFSQAMAKWREFNQTKAMQAHSQWVDKINKFQNMERFAKTFYERFMLDLKNRKLCQANKEECYGNPQAQVKEDSFAARMQAQYDAAARGDLSTKIDHVFLNYRQYPLYGVEPLLTDSKEPDKWKNMYMVEPDNLQQMQQEKVHKVAQLFEAYLTRKGMDSSDLKNHKQNLKEIIEGLKSEDPYKNGVAINLMRSLANASSKEVNDTLQAILQDHLNMMGRPAPLLYYGQGFPYIFETHEMYKDQVREVELPEFYRHLRLSTQFRFEKKTDYLMYHMLCGPNPERGGIENSVVDGTLGNLYGYGMLGFRDIFVPPRIISENLDLDICKDKLNFDVSGKMYSQWILDTASNTKYAGAFNVIDQSLTENMKKISTSRVYDITAEEKTDSDRSKVLNKPIEIMSIWWEKYVENQVQTQLEKFKVQYEEIAVKFYEAQFKDNGTLLGLPIHSAVVRNSVVNSGMQESRTYSLVLSELLRKYIPENEMSKLIATNPQLAEYKDFKKLTSSEEVLTFQKRPFHQDFAAMKAGTAPKLFKFQLINEEILSEIYWTMKKAELVDKTDLEGKVRKVVDLKMTTNQVEDFEKKIEELIKKMHEEIDALAKFVPATKANAAGQEREKPHRIIEFSKIHMAQIAKDMVASLTTIKFASTAAESYSKKNKTEDDHKRDRQRAKDQEDRKQCIKKNSAAGITGGGGC